MRLRIEIPHQFDDLLTDLALCHFRTIPAEAAYLVTRGIEEAVRQRELERARYFDEVVADEKG